VLQRISATVGYRKEKRQVSMIIDIDGPSAVGKTTLITKLEKNRLARDYRKYWRLQNRL
jgi:uridine kinase